MADTQGDTRLSDLLTPGLRDLSVRADAGQSDCGDVVEALAVALWPSVLIHSRLSWDIPRCAELAPLAVPIYSPVKMREQPLWQVLSDLVADNWTINRIRSWLQIQGM